MEKERKARIYLPHCTKFKKKKLNQKEVRMVIYRHKGWRDGNTKCTGDDTSLSILKKKDSSDF